MVEQEIVRLVLDPHVETADIDTSDNEWPKKPKSSRFKLFKQRDRKNPMQLQIEADQDEDLDEPADVEEEADAVNQAAAAEPSQKKSSDSGAN